MPARTTAQLEPDARSARKQGAAAASVMVDRRASAGAGQALQAKLQDSQQAAQLRALQAKMAAPPLVAAQRAGIEDEDMLQGKFVPAQRAGVEEEELLQGKFATAQRAGIEDEDMLQGKFVTAQRAGIEDEDMLQGKFATAQRAGVEEEELLQGKFVTTQRAGIEDEDMLQGKFATAQRAGLEEEEPLQGKFATAQRASLDEEEPLQGKFEPVQAKENNTGLPDNLKSGIENLSGMAMDGVKVHYNSSQPAALNAHAYAQGSDIHVAPGQEQHLPHEAWHVVQQRQGRVQPTMQMAGVQVNDDQGLEHEADVMGAKALSQA